MKFVRTVLLACLLIPATSFADTRIAVVNPVKAIFETDLAQARGAELEAANRKDDEHLTKLREDIQGITDKLKRDGKTMSTREQMHLSDDREAKIKEHEEIQAEAQKRLESARKQLIGNLKPKYDEAVAEVARQQGIDIVLSNREVEFAGEKSDITAEVTKRINQMK